MAEWLVQLALPQRVPKRQLRPSPLRVAGRDYGNLLSLPPRKPLSQMLRYHKNLLNQGIVGF